LPAGGSLSPIILADNSLVLGIGNQIQVIANSSDPIGGVPIWNITLSIATPEASDWRSVRFVRYCPYDERQIQRLTHGHGATCTRCPWILAIADTAGGRSVPRYVLWRRKLLPAHTGRMRHASAPHHSDRHFGLRSSDWLFSRWTFNGSFVGAYHKPACHPSGMMVVMDGDATLVAFQAVGTLVSELWRRSTGALHVVRAPVIDADGNVYVIGGAVMSDANPAKLLAFDHVGNLACPWLD